MTVLARYFALLGMLAALAAAAYVRSNTPVLAVLNQKIHNHAKMQGRWTGCYMDTRAEVVRCTEE